MLHRINKCNTSKNIITQHLVALPNTDLISKTELHLLPVFVNLYAKEHKANSSSFRLPQESYLATETSHYNDWIPWPIEFWARECFIFREASSIIHREMDMGGYTL